MELIGMGLGSFFLGGMADKMGRRPTTLCCLLVMASGMFMVTTTGSIVTLSFWRIITGVGIGGLLNDHVAPVAIFRWIWSLMLVRLGPDGQAKRLPDLSTSTRTRQETPRARDSDKAVVHIETSRTFIARMQAPHRHRAQALTHHGRDIGLRRHRAVSFSC